MVAVCEILFLVCFLTESSPVKAGPTTLLAPALLCIITSDFDDEVAVARSHLVVKLAFKGGFRENRGNLSGSTTGTAKALASYPGPFHLSHSQVTGFLGVRQEIPRFTSTESKADNMTVFT